MRLLNILLGHLAVFGIAVGVSTSCSVNYPTTAFRCSPFDGDDACPSTGDNYLCCSDDPAAMDLNDLTNDVLPGYQGRGGSGVPVFSGGNNPLSKTGMCIKQNSVAPAFALADINATGCPVPCNPTWGSSDIATVCGAGSFCCQTVELEPQDCIQDLETGCFRPVTGNDIQGVGTPSYTNWGGTAHATHQDPSGTNCEVFANGLVASGAIGSDELNTAKRECWRRLTVANQRGFCLGGPGVVGCPLAQPTYADACEQINLANGLVNCL